MEVRLNGRFKEQEMELPVADPRGANRLFIFTGIAALSTFRGNSLTEWTRELFTFEVGRPFDAGEVHEVMANVSLASVVNEEGGVLAGWAVDYAVADHGPESGRVRVTTRIAVYGTGAVLCRVAYTVHVLAKVARQEHPESAAETAKLPSLPT